MKRGLLLWIIMLTVSVVRGQLYTGGQGDGATMSCVPPKVTTLSQTDITCVSDTVILAIYATGSDLQFVWQKFRNNFFEDLTAAPYLIGLGTDTLRIVKPDKDRDDGLYRCLVKNSCDADTSETFVLDLNFAPVIQKHLSTSDYAQFVCANMYPTVSLISGIFSPQGDHHYSWTKVDSVTGAGTRIPDTTSYLNIDISGAALDVEGLYVVTASNACGVVSDSVYLPVYRKPEIIWQNVVNGKIGTCVGEPLTLSAIVTGGGIYTYKLQKIRYDESLAEWRVINSESMSQPEKRKSSVVVGDEGYWRWVATNQCGEAVSDPVYISVEGSPSFSPLTPGTSMFPSDTTVCEGGSVQLICKASGSATRYYWLKDGKRIEGCDTNVLTLNDLKVGDEGIYVCNAYNSCLKTVSARPIHLKLSLRPRFERNPYLPKRACVGDTLVLFRAHMDMSIPVDSVRWAYNGELLYDNDHYEDCDKLDFFIHNIGKADLGLYQLVAYNACGASISEIVNLFDLALPVSFQKGVGGYDALLCPGAEQKLSVAVAGSSPIHYKWILNEHSYESDTNFVTIHGQDVTELNKYTVYAYNACGSAIDTGWLNVERFDHYKFVGNGEICEGYDPTGYLELQGSDTSLNYTLYRDYGVSVKTFKGTGDVVKFEDMPSGVYYVVAENPKTECVQEMDGRPEIKKLKSPAKANFFVSAYYCPGSAKNGAELVLTDWEKDVTYTLERYRGVNWEAVDYGTFTGGIQIFDRDELNSPDPGKPKIYQHVDYGRYRVIAKNPLRVNQCTTAMVLQDSIYLLESPSRHILSAAHGDTINCLRTVDGQPYAEKTTLEVDRFMKGATYTLYKNGVVDPDHEPDKTSPISWALIGEGTYKVQITTREGCEGTTNEVRVRDVKAPAYQTLSGSGSLCAAEDTETSYKTLTIDSTEVGVVYSVYQSNPSRLVQTVRGSGHAENIIVPPVKATYYVIAADATGRCETAFEKEYTMLASDFQVATNPADIYLDGKGKTTWLHVDITGSYVQPLQVKWEDEAQLQQTGLVQLPNVQYFKHFHWPFCPCAEKHDSWGSTWVHEYSHGPQCNLTNCPFLYHKYDPKKEGCTYVGTEYQQYSVPGGVSRGPWYDLYFCKGGVNPDATENYYENDTTNPFRNRLTTPVNEDRIYKVTVTDGAGCTHQDEVAVRVLGGKLRAEIMYTKIHKHYEYPFCPCYGQHHYTHYCSSACNEDNCIRLYHAHKHEGCTKLHTETIEYKGRRVKYYDEYFCCTNNRANDTIVYRNDMVYFCSDVKGGDYNYLKKWSFYAPGDNTASWLGKTGDTVRFAAKESGWLTLRVTSMGQEVRDSIWIEVLRRPFEIQIQDADNHRLDTLDICKGDEVRLYGYTTTGDDETIMQWWGEGFDGPSERWWIFEPGTTGNYIFTAKNDGVVKKDTVYIRIQNRPPKPVIKNPGKRCVASGVTEKIRVEGPTMAGGNYVLEYSSDRGESYIEYKREDNSAGGPIEFRVTTPVRDSGLYRVKVEGVLGSHVCDTYSDLIEFITPPSHDEIVSKDYCHNEQLTIRLRSTQPNMSYSILNSVNRVMETIDSPLSYFDKTFVAGDYKIVYTHKGMYHSCSDTVEFKIKEVPQARRVDVIVNNGAGACEGMNAVITIPNSELNVKYYLESPTGEKIDLFIGNGGSMSANVGARSYGTYQVKAEQGSCATLIDYFVFDRNPQPIIQPDVHYCYPYGGAVTMGATKLEYNNLEASVVYSLYRDGVLKESIEGPGTKSFNKVYSGNYTIIAKHKESGCTEQTSFVVDAKENPKDFKLKANCEKDKNITLEYSQVGIEYILYRDTLMLDTLFGTGSALEFGVYNTTGRYNVVGIDTVYGCQMVMDGEIVINEIGHCDLVQETPICEIKKTTALVYPCSKKGWTYYIKDVTDPATPTSSSAQAGNGSTIRWESMGTTGKLFGPHMIDRVNWIPSVYVLYGKDVCGDVALDTISISLQNPPAGTIEVNGVVLSANSNKKTATIAVCARDMLEFFLSNVQEGVNCTLIGIKSDNYRDTLTHFVATAEHINRKSIGTFGIRQKYELHLQEGSCESVLIYTVSEKQNATTDHILGNSVCEGDGTLEIKLVNKDINHNYYLFREGERTALDTILYTSADMVFAPQNAPGRYAVVAENVDPIAGGGYTRICRDTMWDTFAIGDAPTRFHVESYPDKAKEIFLCTGATKTIRLLQSESTVDYALMRNGVKYSDFQHKANGSSLDFGVSEAGEYIVRGFLGSCEVDMLDTIMVYEDALPDLELYDKYYFCREADGGAEVEIYDVPMLTTFELRNAGPYGDVIARDTVRRRGDTVRFDMKLPVGDKYVMTVKTFGGCQFNHPFVVEKMTPPASLSLILTADAICEGNCTNIGIIGDQGGIEYTLMKKTAEGDIEYNNNFVMGFGGRDTLWFEYPICETGDYYVMATQYERPYCETLLQYNNQNLIALATIDTLRECYYADSLIHYCGADGTAGGTITLLNAQRGIEYSLWEGDSLLDANGMTQVATTEGQNLTWVNIPSHYICKGEGDKYTEYRIVARNPVTGCTKRMNIVKMFADGYINTLAVTQPYYEFCDGGDLLLSVRAEGCGLKYLWKHVAVDGTTSIGGNQADMLLRAATPDMSGSYYCEISNACMLTPYKTAPYIEVNVRPNGSKNRMGSKNVCEGESDMIYSKMTNVNEGDYVWYRKGSAEVLSRNSYLRLDSITSDMQGYYICVGGDMGNGYCNVLYDTVFLNVVANVDNFKIEQRYDSLCIGEALTITLPQQVPAGYLANWYLDGVAIPAVGNAYQKADVHLPDAGLYSVELKHTLGETCGKGGLIPVSQVRVDSMIDVLWHTEDKYMCQPGKLALSVRTSPMVGVQYDWYQMFNGGGEEYIGSGRDITTQFPDGTSHVTYRVYYHNSCPSDYWSTTNVEEVEVNIASNAGFTKNLPSEITGCEGDIADTTLVVAVDGVRAYDYVWTFTPASTTQVDTVAKGAMPVSGETSYTIPYQHGQSGFYTCVLNTDCGRMVSQACWVRVNTPAAITVDLAGGAGKMCEGSYYSPSITATGSDLQFRWFVTYPDGRVDTVRKAIGYEWDATDQLSLLTDVKYNGAELQCVVWNNCGRAVSSPVELEIVAPREIRISPAETWLCCDSTAKVEVTLLNGDGGTWDYRLKRDDYNPMPVRTVVAGRDKDTVTNLISGSYAVVGLNDHVCDYKDKVMAEFKVHDLPPATVDFSLVSGRRDTTVCANGELPLWIKIAGGTGDYEVSVYYQEATMPEPEIYNLWMGTNPFILRADVAARGYRFLLPILKEAKYTVKVVDMGKNLVSGGCPVEVAASQTINVRMTTRLNVTLSQTSSLIFGECELDIDLRACLNPSPAGGTFHLIRQKPGPAAVGDTIDREWAYAHILKSDGPGVYKIGYSLGGVCKEVSNNSLTITVDTLPYAHITPVDTMLCCGSGSPNLQAFLHGAAPFDSLLIETHRMKDDGSTTSGSSYYKIPTLRNPQNLYFSMSGDCSDSLARYVVTGLKDGHGCYMSPSKQVEALISIHKLPVMKVVGFHPSYSGGFGDEMTQTYNLNTGDSVTFKVSLQGGKKPWNLSVAFMTTPPPGVPDEQLQWTVSGVDTLITLKKEGYYVFDAAEVGGCAQAGSAVTRQLRFAPPGYITIKGLYLGGALSHLLNTAPIPFASVRMKSDLPFDASFPDYGYDPLKFNQFNMLPDVQVIDWIFVEARKMDRNTGNWSVVDRDTCLLLANGKVVDRNFSYNLKFDGTGIAGDQFYVAVFHRNHLPVMTAHAQGFSSNGIGTPISFGYTGNYYFKNMSLEYHVWNFWTYAGQEFWVMAPSYKQINPKGHLVSMSNATESYFQLDAAAGLIMGILPGYYIWDVTFNGLVEIPPILSNFMGLPTMGVNEDAWMLYQNRDRYSEIEEY